MKVMLTVEFFGGSEDGAQLVSIVDAPSVFHAIRAAEVAGMVVHDAEPIPDDAEARA